MGAPRVSVVIGTYNRGPLVVQAVQSVLAQTYRDLEVVVCDDGSEDDTAARVCEFGPPVRYLRVDHTGGSGAPRNRGVDAARGEMIAFLDDDDLWDPHKLALQVAMLDARPELDCVVCDCRVLDDDRSRTRVVPAPTPDHAGRLLDRVLGGEIPSLCGLVARRQALGRAGGFLEAPVSGVDFEFWLRLARVARVGRVPEPLVLVRQQAGSLSRRMPEGAVGTFIASLERERTAADLTVAQHLRCRRTLAQQYARLALTCAEQGDRAGARRAALRGIRRFPASRNAWRAAARAWAN